MPPVRSRVASTLLALALVASALATGSAVAAPGELDPSFGTGGIVRGPSKYLGQEYTSIAIDPAGRILTAGASPGPGIGNPVVNWPQSIDRFLPDGAPDASFGDGGVLNDRFGALRSTRESQVAVGGDGSIWFADRRLDGGHLTHLTSAGTGFPGFGTDGDLHIRRDVRAAAPVPGGAFVVLGTDHGAKLARVTDGGIVDLGFGEEGRAQIPLDASSYDQSDQMGTPPAAAYPLLVRPDGSVLVGGARAGTTAIAGFDANGAPLRGFGDSGVAVVSGTIGPVGAIAASGRNVVISAGVRVARLGPTGAVDRGFGLRGTRSLDLAAGGRTRLSGIAVQDDGAIVVVGHVDAPTRPTPYGSGDGVFARLTPSGGLDCRYAPGGYGRVRTPVGMTAFGAVAIDTAGRAVAAGLDGPEQGAGILARIDGGARAAAATGPPAVVTRPALPSSALRTAVLLRSWVDPACADTTARFQWGATNAYGRTTARARRTAAAGPRPFTAALRGLPRGTYHYRVVADGPFGRRVGRDATFSVPAPRSGRLRLTGTRIDVDRGMAVVSVACLGASCPGVRLTLTRHGRTLGRLQTALDRDTDQLIGIPLSPRGQRLLRRPNTRGLRVTLASDWVPRRSYAVTLPRTGGVRR